MSLASIKAMKAEKGFTIVELLIVIVIIGILAAIVIVAYNGITQRANDTNYKSAASQIDKIAEAYNADNGSYPQTLANFTSYTSAPLPTGTSIWFPTTTPPANTYSTGTADPTAATTGAVYKNTTTGTTFYAVKACGASLGLDIYYAQTAPGGTLGVTKSGTGC
jgi:prepilin-type N-terminal cleavage/methylation domain-containing protein